jgi:hypothetical protein
MKDAPTRHHGLVLVLILAACLCSAAVHSQEAGFLVYRIEPDSEICRASIGGPSHYGSVYGRFKLLLTGDDPEDRDVSFVDISTGANPQYYNGFLPTFSGEWHSGSLYGYSSALCDSFSGFAEPGQPLELSGGDSTSCPCCPDYPKPVYSITAAPEPILTQPLQPMAGQPIPATVHWFSNWGEVLATEVSVAHNGNQIDVFADVTTDGDFFVGPRLYSIGLELPPLSAGVYQVRYWQDITPDLYTGYEHQGDTQLMVQGIVPATGTLGRALLVLTIILTGVLLLRRLSG